MNIDQNDIEQYLSEVKDAVENDRYRLAWLDRNARRQDNINLFLDYVIDEAKAREIILGLTVMDFVEIQLNEHKGYEHEKLYVFGKNVVLLERMGTEEKTVPLYIKFDKLENCFVIVFLFKEQKEYSYILFQTIKRKSESIRIITKEKQSRDFCIKCRRETEYLLHKKNIVKTIRNKEYVFGITVALCSECGGEMSIPGIIDKNVQEIDEQYKAVEGLVSVNDIEKLMKIYKIGKASLSLALGFGETTIPGYLEGQIPSKECSDVVRAALASPAYMKKRLMENRDKLTDAEYKKTMSAADAMVNMFSSSEISLMNLKSRKR